MEQPNDARVSEPVVAQVPDDYAKFEELANAGAKFVGAGEAVPEKKETPAEPAGAGASSDAGGAGDGSEDGDEGAGEGQGKEGSDEEKAAAKKKGGFQRKIERLERENEELKAKLPKQDPPADNPAGAEPTFTKPRPVSSNFGTYEEYEDAVALWNVEKRDFSAVVERQKTEIAAKTKEIVDAHQARQAEFSQAHTDYDEKLESIADVMFAGAFNAAVLKSDISAAIVYELASNRAEAERIAALSLTDPAEALVELGVIKSRLKSSTPVKTKTPSVSQAPDPITPGGRGGKAPVQKVWTVTDPDCPLDVFEKLQRDAGR